MTTSPTKTVLAYYGIRGWTKGAEDDTILEPEDVLVDESESEVPVFRKGEELELRFADIPFTARAKVVKVHNDEFGSLVQARINHGTLKPSDVS
jgi:hypothetical protein